MSLTHAFLEVGTLDDLDELIRALRQGLTVGVAARPGLLYGPVEPTRLIVDPASPITSLPAFLRAYSAHEGKSVCVAPCDDLEAIRAAWRHLGYSAALPLTRIQIVELCAIVAEWVGSGTIELQFPYGDDGWTDFVRRSLGHLVLYHQPSATEIQEFADYGAKGVILAPVATKRHAWFAGMGGSFPMPHFGTIVEQPGDTPPQIALERAGAALRLGGRWDNARRFLPLCGVLLPEDCDRDTLREVSHAVKMERAKYRTTMERYEVYATVAHPTIPRAGAGAYVVERWDEVFRVDFSADGSSA
ncbi:hypothetical protein LNAOJCKE_0431 [Methylorubrum aminovorans]|uniref:Uncharacterized protein n=1 Tax=Methylorubrum aminovorans TaxID=269069 RepID=A0ABQ4U8P7_9HYPH|nr:hypothetical protein [Methylorubrum aminovorans]GJE63237.1 hypothetical protein LNAOJCKE_0431 [Methylorubrum aminovorans]